MKNIFSLGLIVLPFLLKAQIKTSSSGIKFEDTLSWQQIITKAKNEKKFVFLDVYASWCGPCKAMDQNIYPSDKVGNFINENFISAKVQVDSTIHDSEKIKRWYKDAHDLQIKYKVNSFPSFLFFSPDGSIVHRAVGYQDLDNFLSLSKDALDSNKQFYSLLNKYEHVQKDSAVMIHLIKILNNMGESQHALAIAKDYKKSYLNNLSDSELFSKEKLAFISSFPNLINSGDRFFYLLFHEGRKVDSLLDWKGRSRSLVDYVIYNENIYPQLYNGKGLPISKHPDWKSMGANIRRKYGNIYADRILLNGQIEWFNRINDSASYTAHLLKKIKKYGTDSTIATWVNYNANAWEFFLFSKNRYELNEALKWADSSIKLNYRASALDTKANLLYKLGRKDEALEYETLAVKKEQEEAQKYKRSPDTSFQITLEKMKNNDPSLYILEMQELYIIIVSG